MVNSLLLRFPIAWRTKTRFMPWYIVVWRWTKMAWASWATKRCWNDYHDQGAKILLDLYIMASRYSKTVLDRESSKTPAEFKQSKGMKVGDHKSILRDLLSGAHIRELSLRSEAIQSPLNWNWPFMWRNWNYCADRNLAGMFLFSPDSCQFRWALLKNVSNKPLTFTI